MLEELEAKAVFLGTQVSFARSARILKHLTYGTVSAEGIRQKIAEQSQKIQLPTPQEGETVLVDSTKVKAGSKERGVPIYLAITARLGAFTFLKEPGFSYIDTSPLEREMRELNRRVDVGARWSPSGVENLLKVLFHQRLNDNSKGQS